MKIAHFRDHHEAIVRIGILDGDVVRDATGLLDPFDPTALDHGVNDRFDLDGGFLERTRAGLDGLPALAVSDVRLLPPVPRPGKVICIGLNYADHAAESGMEPPESPLVFSKFPSNVVGPDDAVPMPLGESESDYEAELAVVIGRRAWRVDEAAAMNHVLGYSCANDLSARAFQFADGQWQRGKSCEGFCPLGPFIATVDEIADPHDLRIRLRLNDETVQDSSTNQLIFGIPALVAHLSSFVTLEPGDVILTGTPPGVGFARKPPIRLKSGDRMEVEIDGLGVLRNTMA
ncbi:MAG: fumarylacetoacetate hydrolase family protein [Planctomycetota bacterium]|nr:fumarylacetoacetate hydrolase family protein [Planctomycetota bacterium]